MKTCSRLSNTLRTERKHLRLSYSVVHNCQNQWSSMIFNWYPPTQPNLPYGTTHHPTLLQEPSSTSGPPSGSSNGATHGPPSGSLKGATHSPPPAPPTRPPTLPPLAPPTRPLTPPPLGIHQQIHEHPLCNHQLSKGPLTAPLRSNDQTRKLDRKSVV